MNPEWHYAIDRVQKGPVTLAELMQLRSDGVIADDTHIWRKGMAGWEPYATASAGWAEEPPVIPTSPSCANCGRPAETDDLVVIGGRKVCAGCKPVVLQRLQEGVAPVPDAAAETLRKAHLRHEASLQGVGSLYLLSGGFMLLLVVSGSGLAMFSPRAGIGAAEVLLVVLLGGLGVLHFWVGSGLRKLKPAVRGTAVVLSALGLFGFPLGTLISGYVLWLLLSEKGKIVFSGEYRQAVLATPHLKCRTSLIAWIALALILVLAGCIIYGVTSRAR